MPGGRLAATFGWEGKRGRLKSSDHKGGESRGRVGIDEGVRKGEEYAQRLL